MNDLIFEDLLGFDADESLILQPNQAPDTIKVSAKPAAAKTRNKKGKALPKRKVGAQVKRQAKPRARPAPPKYVVDDDVFLDDEPRKQIGTYTPEERKARIQRYLDKRKRRVWDKKIRYASRKRQATQRPRFNGRFVRSPEDLLKLQANEVATASPQSVASLANLYGFGEGLDEIKNSPSPPCDYMENEPGQYLATHTNSLLEVKQEPPAEVKREQEDDAWLDTLTTFTMPDDGSDVSFPMASSAALRQAGDDDFALGMNWAGEIKVRSLGGLQLESAMSALTVTSPPASTPSSAPILLAVNKGIHHEIHCGAPAGSPGAQRCSNKTAETTAEDGMDSYTGQKEELGVETGKVQPASRKHWHSGGKAAHVGGDGGDMAMRERSSSSTTSGYSHAKEGRLDPKNGSGSPAANRTCPIVRTSSAQDLCMSRWREEENVRSAAAAATVPVPESTTEGTGQKRRTGLWDALFGCCESRRYHLVATASSSAGI
jgi:hypothetical protein